MATLTVQTINDAGSSPTFTAASPSGDQFINSGNQVFVIDNTGGGDACIVTITAEVTSIDLTQFGTVTKANTILTVDAGSIGTIGGLYTAIFNDGSNYAQITYDQVDEVLVAVLINQTQI
tara:strand:+ start:7609 stop:7968 length:360 start_codon:yes stop_codon:yes gene_type:complete